MNVHLIYFSPGGTTRRTVRKIAEGIKDANVIEHDMLKKENREKQYNFTKDDLVIFGMMTATKIFGPIEDILNCMQGNNTPLVGVVMFGNGYYGGSLKQMKKLVEPKGFKMVAAGAFIGQHGINKKIAANRPDAKDEMIQLDFGRKIHNKVIINNDHSFNSKLKTDWPPNDAQGKFKCALILAIKGNGNATIPASMNKLVFTDDCIECGKCERNCPTGAINLATKSFDFDKCYGCFSCGSNCPKGAIKQTNKTLMSAVNNAYEKRKNRREPVIFL
jgi:ferredoxin/flavodoxin